MSDLAIDLYLPGTTNTPATLTMHGGALQTSYISETGNHVGKTTMPEVGTTRSWFLLSRVDVVAPDATGAIVAFGDSITDGARSTADTNNRWPDHLARRLQSQGIKMGVLNAGIGGNRVLNEAAVPAGVDMRAVGAGINALARFERHVLSLPGVTHVIVLEGINDIGNARQNPTPTAEDLIAAHKQLIEQAHARGLKIFGATLTPFWGAAYYTEVGEAKRQALNEWIRTGKAYDGVVDFDKATRDPSDPKKLLEKYDSCDYLHPSDAGYKAMGDAIDLSLFKSGSGDLIVALTGRQGGSGATWLIMVRVLAVLITLDCHQPRRGRAGGQCSAYQGRAGRCGSESDADRASCSTHQRQPGHRGAAAHRHLDRWRRRRAAAPWQLHRRIGPAGRVPRQGVPVDAERGHRRRPRRGARADGG